MKYFSLLVTFLILQTSAFAATASWYDSASVKKEGTCHAEKCYTASGKEIHALEAKGDLFAASNEFRMGTKVKVTNKRNGKSVVATVRDRGGFGKYGRKIDLGKLAFSRIENPKRGLVEVNIEKIG